MSGPFGSSQFMYATGALAEGSSLRVAYGDSPDLTRTNTSAPTNNSKGTFSCWIKRGLLGNGTGNSQYIIHTGTGTSNDTHMDLKIGTSDQISIGAYSITPFSGTAKFRDPSAWYHIVVAFDSTSATASDRQIKVYVNGEETAGAKSAIAQNQQFPWINQSQEINIFRHVSVNRPYDGYIANVCMIDGQALTPTSFGEYEDTLWKPKSDTDIQALTFGTNGFYLPMKQTTEAEGFSTVTYTGNGGTQSIEGVGFEPDFVWIKSRNDATASHWLTDSVRGDSKGLLSNSTSSEITYLDIGPTLATNGFEVRVDGSNVTTNGSGKNYVAWCWDAGTGSAASNTDGSITSSVKANTTNGFSIVSYTGSGANATVGHGLSSAPEMILFKKRDVATSWMVYNETVGNNRFLYLDLANGQTGTDSTYFNNTSPTSSVIHLGTYHRNNSSTEPYIAYCFHSVSGYSDIGSYTGTGAAGNAVTTGFAPAFVMIKRTDIGDSWGMFDNTRDTNNPNDQLLYAERSDAESTNIFGAIDFDSNGFTVNGIGSTVNNSGGTYIYMAFADTRDATFFGDTSGNSNNWTPNALNNTDVVPDSPVTNFATLNALTYSGAYALTLSEGNLVAREATGNATWKSLWSTFAAPTSGKWYAEFYLTYTGATGFTYQAFAGLHDGLAATTYIGQSSGSYGYIASGGTYNNATHTTSYGASYGSGDIIGVAWDADNGDLTFYKNGVSQGTAYSSVSAENKFFGVSAIWVSPDGQTFWHCNFGQDSSFAGLETPQGNTDDNGQGDFYYAPPSGFLALNRNNLPTPDILDPADYFNTVLYTGNSSTQSITGVNFQPDWVWIKNRTYAYDHMLFDAVRGTESYLESNTTDAESNSPDVFTSFDVDGFTVEYGPSTRVNESGSAYVAWNWLAGGTAVSNTDGSMTSSVSANTDAGFSIIDCTTTAANSTCGHGLSEKPELVIAKQRDGTSNWYVLTDIIDGSSDYLRLDLTAAKTDYAGSAPTATTITLPFASGASTISYAFHSVESYSKIGTYTGNGSADGTYVHCGFRPAWVMVKRTDDTSNWLILDNKREGYNPDQDGLDANGSGTEGTAEQSDFLSNGFKVRNNSSGSNASGGTFIFLAFAEAPFRNANAR